MTDLSSPLSSPVDRMDVVRALVVDDEALIRWSVAETLATLDIEVEQAGDAARALEAISRADGPFDIVVLDLRLPDVNDLTLLRRVRQLLPDAFVLLMTAFGTPEIIAEARALGAQGVLSKPFALEDLSRLLAQRGGATTS
jgi:DNA-binding NtrC family response regulator